MVRMLNSGEIRPEAMAAVRAAKKVEVVKMEIEDHLEEEHGPFSKKFKLAASSSLLCGAGASLFSQDAVPTNLSSEPSPLGLRLKKTPSFLDLIQMRLSQVHSAAAACAINLGTFEDGKKNLKSIAGSAIDKMKASNFPAAVLTIGTWEYVSRYEGDLVAKCYYAKHKLVWEVLGGGLKSKIEIQWSDIAAIKATFPENGPSTLDIVLLRQPLFFRENDPQPRKHTLWQATSDFTGGQASIYRRHLLQCSQGVLNKHFEKLIQCDPRLNSLSQEQEIVLECPYFEPHCCVFNGPDDSKCHAFESMEDDFNTAFSGFHRTGSSASIKSKDRELTTRAAAYNAARETLSPISVINSPVNAMMETEELMINDHHAASGLKSSMSMKDLADHLEHCISEKVTSSSPADGFSKDLLFEEISQHLLSDNPVLSASDELLIMSKVNSFCSLLQKDDNGLQDDDANRPQLMMIPGQASETTMDTDRIETSPCKRPSLSRKESFGDLLVHLPRIASLPKFLFNISEKSDNQTRR